MIIIASHAVQVCFALLIAKAVEYISHLMRDPHHPPTFGTQLFDFGVQLAEGVLAPGVFLIGTFFRTLDVC